MSAPAPSMFSPAAKAMAEQARPRAWAAPNLEEFADTLLALAKADRRHPRRDERLARLRQARPVRPGAAAADRRSRHRRAEPRRHRRRPGVGRQEVVRRLAGVLSDGPGAGADQERRLLLRRAGRGRRHQRRRELRRARQHAPFAARPGRAAGDPQHHGHRAGRQLRDARGRARRRHGRSTRSIFRFGKAPMLRPARRGRRSSRSARRSRSATAATWRSSRPAKRSSTPCSRPAQLAELGLDCRVLSMHTIKPLDADAVLAPAASAAPSSPSKSTRCTADWARRARRC